MIARYPSGAFYHHRFNINVRSSGINSLPDPNSPAPRLTPPYFRKSHTRGNFPHKKGFRPATAFSQNPNITWSRFAALFLHLFRNMVAGVEPGSQSARPACGAALARILARAADGGRNHFRHGYLSYSCHTLLANTARAISSETMLLCQ